MQNLLRDIIQNTKQSENNQVFKIKNLNDFLSVATIQYTTKSVETLSHREKTEKARFNETVEEINFFFDQQIRLNRIALDPAKSETIQQRLSCLLDIINDEVDRFEDLLFENLRSHKGNVVKGSVYILCSLQRGTASTKYLNRVLGDFSGPDKKRQPFFVEGLKWGRHPSIDSGLGLLTEIADPQVQERCLEILDFRDEE